MLRFHFLLLSFPWFQSSGAQGTQLLRQPTSSSSHIVLVYANDFWKVSRDGGTAIRLTSNESAESLPHFSPDERWMERLKGEDPQLERTVEDAMRLCETCEFQLKPEPPPPMRWKRPEGFQN